MSYHLSVPELLQRAVREVPAKEAVYDGYQRISYQQLYENVQLLASSLAAKGIQKGDRMIVFLPNWQEFVSIYFAAATLGAILVPANIRYRREELQYILVHSGAKAIFIGEGLSILSSWRNSKMTVQRSLSIFLQSASKKTLICHMMNCSQQAICQKFPKYP